MCDDLAAKIVGGAGGKVGNVSPPLAVASWPLPFVPVSGKDAVWSQGKRGCDRTC